jgi:hypothetical protein
LNIKETKTCHRVDQFDCKIVLHPHSLLTISLSIVSVMHQILENSRNKQFACFKLYVFMGSMMKAHCVPAYSTRGVSHLFVFPCVQTQCLCSSKLILLNNGPKAQK